jgi:hypothetical protein
VQKEMGRDLGEGWVAVGDKVVYSGHKGEVTGRNGP